MTRTLPTRRVALGALFVVLTVAACAGAVGALGGTLLPNENSGSPPALLHAM